MATILKRIGEVEFDKLADQTRLGDAARSMARMVLVEGQLAVDVAKQFGMSKQRVGLAVESIRRAHQSVGTTRNGWVKVELELPERWFSQLHQVLDALRASSSASAQTVALSQVEHALQRALQTLQDDAP
jgi:hypothetical protein